MEFERGLVAVAIQYTNRIGKIYFLRGGKTKTGKPRYFFSAQENEKGEAVEHIPDGYEIYEHPESAQVFLRKKRLQLMTDIEIQLIKKHVSALKRSKRYRVDFKDKYIIIYESNMDVINLEGVFGDFTENSLSNVETDIEKAISAFASVADRQYTAVLRFHLVDEKKRKFTAERFCFGRFIDDWMFIGDPDKFINLVEKHVHTLGTDEFYNSPYY
jgi:hypothetical protein